MSLFRAIHRLNANVSVISGTAQRSQNVARQCHAAGATRRVFSSNLPRETSSSSSHSVGGVVPGLKRPMSELGISATRARMQDNLRAEGDAVPFFNEGVDLSKLTTLAILGSAVGLYFASKIYYSGKVSEEKLALARFDVPLRRTLNQSWFMLDGLAVSSIVVSAIVYTFYYSSPIRAVLMLGFFPGYLAVRTLSINRDEVAIVDERLRRLYPGQDFSCLEQFERNKFLSSPRPPNVIAAVEKPRELTGAQAGEEVLRSYGVQGDDGKTTVYDVKDIQPHSAYYHPGRDPKFQKQKVI